MHQHNISCVGALHFDPWCTLNLLSGQHKSHHHFPGLSLYWCYNPHRSRDSISPVCGIFLCISLCPCATTALNPLRPTITTQHSCNPSPKSLHPQFIYKNTPCHMDMWLQKSNIILLVLGWIKPHLLYHFCLL